MDKHAPIIVARACTGSEAFVIKNLLESYNIPCHYASRVFHLIYPLNIQGLGEIRIYVPASLAQEARRILDEHRRNNVHLRLVEAE
jgi:Putative prokaryotic signal transducing protein